jgi:Mg-chelatase subunit ChlD
MTNQTQTQTETTAVVAESTGTMVPTQSALDRLTKSAAKSSLDDLLKSKMQRSLLLVDCSGSMDSWLTRSHERRIDALRKIVRDLRETHPVPVAAFGGGGVTLIDDVPEPTGGTPMHSGIEYGHREGATHLIVITDGHPDSERATFEAAERFGGPVDVFYVGDGNDSGARFAKELAKRTGGTAHLSSLEKPKELTTTIVGLLGDGGAL